MAKNQRDIIILDSCRNLLNKGDFMTICARPYNHREDPRRQADGLLILPAEETGDFGLPEFRVPLCGSCFEATGNGSGGDEVTFRLFEDRQEPMPGTIAVRGERAL
ncbi:hypothetical protein COV53_05170 [Candidatus Gottesmanbacteria bacterium CG11_big_fil_rev_8_21_14_0_20_37_11]|uniref:Uncharacterized protein n=1 Tax=Candidatus Gottesmanbacteria bacterium CG11_big_fil_rev_8_21_14_0_20_37_11 TaxID=1974575 RepID=A0A2H0NGJ3_9BACT|nr:MAG: hypothetical protein COX23_02760 [Candidatus Gottesmanbacteria bacterium CG23_combo_of_CG06-09_8_20_14_all_37_19]PIR08029.1 MAG: hypothetical protein COV53_05170 [Candidatus Gottesmanbacteria bacterium CG11_big_fil_rev_8_21_14_0_20_37_11]